MVAAGRKKATRKKAKRKKAGAKKSRTTRAARGDVDYETVRAIGRGLPGIEEGLSYGTPALRVRGKLLVRLREDPDSLMVRADIMYMYERQRRILMRRFSTAAS